ncbi:MAG: hypothetical protein Q9170_007533 [Blastenia crenularia]
MLGSLSNTVAQNLLTRIQVAIPKNPQLATLLQEITTYIEESRTALHLQPNGHGPESKKRRLEVSEDSASGEADSINDISFSIPQRKKLKLELGRNKDKGAIRACHPTSRETEFSLPWRDVEYCICVPVPEKAQPSYNYCVFPQGDGEQILFTIPGAKVKQDTITSDAPVDGEESYKDAVTRLLNKRLKTKVLEPDVKEFASQVIQAYRKGEKAVHVKAFRGSKDGFLFFLSAGILWGFKKPLEFFPFHAISAISYTSVLQRTFNLNINIIVDKSSASEGETRELEFSMVDQADFGGIDAYVKRHGLQDASMAEQRRAKKLNINGVSKKIEEGTEEDGDGEGELQKAAREVEEMEDEDEEEDENFDPGSDGESEGSGSSSEEEEVDHGGRRRDGADLVEEELGSEAEEPMSD